MKSLLIALGATLALAGCASAPAQREPALEAGQGEGRPFIERSLVLVPEQVGEFRLVSSEDFPGRPELGAGLRYAHPDFPDVLINLFVYPFGRGERVEALGRGMADFRTELAALVEQGRYADVQIGEDVDFNLDAVADDGRVMPAVDPPSAGGAGVARTDEEKLLAAIAEAEASLDPDLGRKLSIRFVRDGEPLDSAAFLFYRGLYLYKGRISASARAMPPENFHRFANHAMARLVPAVAVRNTGACHSMTINVDPDADPEAVAQQLAVGATRSLARSENEGCRQELDETVPPEHRAIELVFPASMWR